MPWESAKWIRIDRFTELLGIMKARMGTNFYCLIQRTRQ
uniref:Uncharacterized protein n=1 Tax=Arundo donax TaxID=35708 RepID=A0A0A9EU41_ARUDO